MADYIGNYTGEEIDEAIAEIATKQNAINAANKLNADFVDDTSSTHKFVTASEKKQISDNADAIGNAESKIHDILDELDTKLPDKGDHTTINGIDVYVSATQPTGNIAEGSIGIGW